MDVFPSFEPVSAFEGIDEVVVLEPHDGVDDCGVTVQDRARQRYVQVLISKFYVQFNVKVFAARFKTEGPKRTSLKLTYD